MVYISIISKRNIALAFYFLYDLRENMARKWAYFSKNDLQDKKQNLRSN